MKQSHQQASHSSEPTPSLRRTDAVYHSLLFVIELLLLVHQVLLEVGEHFHRDVHLPRELGGLVLQVLLLLAQPVALLLGPVQLGALPLQLGLEATHAGRYLLLHLQDERRLSCLNVPP